MRKERFINWKNAIPVVVVLALLYWYGDCTRTTDISGTDVVCGRPGISTIEHRRLKIPSKGADTMETWSGSVGPFHLSLREFSEKGHFIEADLTWHRKGSFFRRTLARWPKN